MKKDITKEVINDKEYMDIVLDILYSPEFKVRKKWQHHENCSLYEHCLAVSYLAYKTAKKRGWRYKDAAIGGLLHDFYYQPWQDNLDKKVPFFKQHGFVHAKEALENSRKHFPQYLNPVVENIILRHMFPLNIVPPKYKEGWLITYIDKKVSMDVVVNIKALPKYLGLARFFNKFKKKVK